MTRGVIIYLILLLGCNISIALGKNPFFEYYFNKYHKNRSTTNNEPSTSPVTDTTENVSSFSTGIFTPENTASSKQASPSTWTDHSRLVSENGAKTVSNLFNETEIKIQKSSIYNPADNVHRTLVITYIAIGVSLAAVAFFVICGILVCCPSCTRRIQKGYIVGPMPVNQPQPPTYVVQPQQPMTVLQHQQPTAVSQHQPLTEVTQYQQPSGLSQHQQPAGVSQHVSSETQHILQDRPPSYNTAQRPPSYNTVQREQTQQSPAQEAFNLTPIRQQHPETYNPPTAPNIHSH